MLRAYSVLGNSQHLDGGSMFGNAPRALWQRWHQPDEAGRIHLACRAVLVDDGERRVLLETGIGAFFSPKLRKRYGVVEEEHVLLESLRKLGVSHSDIDVVVLSHLHFDHAGGLLDRYEPGAPPRLLFDKARYLVGRSALERASSPHPRDQASFIPELPQLLQQSGRLLVADTPDHARTILGDPFSFLQTDGHTPGMLHATVRGRSAELFFCADLVPGRAWLRLPITMGYDRFPELLVNEKREVLGRSAERGSWLVFTHDPAVAAVRIRASDDGFGISDEQVDPACWELE